MRDHELDDVLDRLVGRVLDVERRTGDLEKLEQAVGPGYKSWVAWMQQITTGNPTATVIKNELGQTLTFTRTSTGIYGINSPVSLFTVNKTFMLATTKVDLGGSGWVLPILNWHTDTLLDLSTIKPSDQTAKDGWQIWVEIRLYP